jgi:hypothetical protein
MLSEIWKALSNVSQGYSLESVKIIISPIQDPDYDSVSWDDYHPRKKKYPIENIENVEQSFNVELGIVPKFRYQTKKTKSTKVVSDDEWILKNSGRFN